MKIPFLGDVIIKEGCVGTKMYFIQEGIVDIVMGTGEVHIILIVIGEHFQNSSFLIQMGRWRHR